MRTRASTGRLRRSHHPARTCGGLRVSVESVRVPCVFGRAGLSSLFALGLGKVFMYRFVPKRLWALILVLFIVSGPVASMFVPGAAYALSPGMVFDPDTGGSSGGNYGDPDDPQSPNLVPGGAPDFSGTDPGESVGGIGSPRVLGRMNSSMWMWRLRILMAGLRF